MPRVLLLNPLSLLGGEVRKALDGRPDLWEEVRLATTDPEQVGTLTEVAGAAALVEGFDPGGAAWDLLMVCDEPFPDPADLRRVGPSTTVIFARAGAAHDAAQPIVAGVNTDRAAVGSRLASPPAPVVLLAHLLAPLRLLGLERAVATVVLPASERSQEGLDELLAQTRSLLTFSDHLPREVWSEQLAFNLMPAEVSGSTLAESLAEVLGGSARVAVRSLQGGIFHGVSASLWVELGSGLQAAEVREAITAGAFVESAEAPQDLGPVAAATTDQILLGEVEKDPSHDGGFWIWAVMDNLTRGGALNAVGVAEELLAPRH